MSEETDTVLPATTADSRKINSIDKETVHKICSGQVVLNLATAVKELVENSLDAGATLIEVKLREQGADLVEVADNGTGVEETNFEGLTAKYHTSKLKEFTDLECIETFGFRGEALSSLCALSDMVITTRHRTAHHATKLTLNHDGRIQTRLPCARSVGTTVTLSNLFATLPVRRKEFQRNIKRDFLRMCQILQAYCLVSVKVRIICTNQSAKGAKTVFLSTHGADNVLDNIRALFGPQQTRELLELKQAIGSNGKIQDLDESDFDDGLALTQEEVDNFNLSQYTIEGYISSCAHGAGRSSKDRQFYYVNSRPCEPRQISKLVNDAYHRFNVHQHPFIFLNLKLDRAEVDVNLTPDKRMVLMNKEKIILLAVRKSIKKTFGSVPSSFKMQNLNLSDSSRLLNVSVPSEDDESTGDRTAVDGCTDGEMHFTFEIPKVPASGSGTGLKRKRNGTDNGLRKIVDFLEANKPLSDNVTEQDESSSDEDEKRFLEPIAKEATCSEGSSSQESEMVSGMVAPLSSSPENGASREQLAVKVESSSSGKVPAKRKLIEQAHSFSGETIEIDESDPPEQADDRDEGVRNRNHHRLTLTMDSLEELIKREQKLQSEQITKRQQALTHLKFKSKINPTSNKAAENELQTEIAKSDFAAMQIVGQFNLGFIVCRLADDLFIVDQHATDEKYNFEDLQQTTELQNQRLMVPQPVELTAVNEMILIDNLDVFEMNGFKFEIDGAAPTTRKVRLIAKPYSRNWEFGKEDIDELIFMLQDATGTVCRPSRVRAMFASRACRKSVMMGTALSLSQMVRLVRHMGEIEQPWNCPHGRPTMRHLVNLAMIYREPKM
ncbi:mismatch repair endonuclease PMS2 [Anopheles bellator]|uniref:mismatch repair endonuclease PMS2 n=1 Tax=Anopheles bellator TaxID=139047 RepID=UPI002647CAC0|nr:mismatch repair endonuclease PMS2 [Anopheles bellator]